MKKIVLASIAGLGLWWLMKPKGGDGAYYTISPPLEFPTINFGKSGSVKMPVFEYKPGSTLQPETGFSFDPVKTVIGIEEMGTAPILSTYTPPMQAAPYLDLIHNAERANGLPHNLLTRLIQQESYFNPNAVSPVGAQGLVQAMPLTAKDPGHGVSPLKDAFNPQEAIPWAAQYLAAMRRYTGSWDKALAAYNWGRGNVNKAVNQTTGTNTHWLELTPRETQNYVAQIGADIPAILDGTPA